jgi:hypothetical protein
MSLIINKVSASSIQITYEYFESDLLFGYNVAANYTVDLTDISFTNSSGVLFEGINALKEAYQQQNLVARIGADEFINGRITGNNFSETSLVGSSKATFTIEESKILPSYSNNIFAANIPSPQWLSSFQENYSFSRSESSYSSTRNVSIQYKQDANGEYLRNAREFLKNFYFANRPNFGYQTDGISENGRIDGGFRPILTETFNLTDLSVSLSENLESSLIENGYSRKQTYSISLNESGYLEKKYNVEIKALKDPLEAVALNACKAIIDELCASNLAQFVRPITIEKGINKDGGQITLSLFFTTDPSKNQTNSSIYEVERTKNGVFYDYAINVSFLSDGATKLIQYSNTKTNWLNFQSTYTAKILSLFSEATAIYEKSRNTSFLKNEGKITESLIFTNDPSYNSSLYPNGIIKFKITNNVQPQMDRIERFVDLEDLIEKVAYNLYKTIGGGSFNLEVVTFKSKGLFFGQNYLDGLSVLSGSQYVSSDQINISSSEGKTSRVINYVFTS